jgi:nicotinate-nucleotide--dimethylbenzimidazole phosphoribosyltransferase
MDAIAMLADPWPFRVAWPAAMQGRGREGDGVEDEARLAALIGRIEPLDEGVMASVRARQRRLLKPPGSLGRLEELSILLGGITRRVRPALARAAVVVAAGDHGVTAEGVSAYPAAVTPRMVEAVLAGGAAISVLARQAGARVRVVDVGVAAPVAPHAALWSARVRPGTANMALGPAMTRAEALAALLVGAEVVAAEVAAGVDVLLAGELGIGNTTAAAALTSALTGAAPAVTAGPGTGLDPAGVRHKAAVIERALAANRPDPADPLGVLAAVGGLEIACLVGLILAGAAARVPVVLDGYITGAAALVAAGLAPPVRPALIAGHRSAEGGHRLVLEALGLRPLVDLDLRLGEGTGAVLALAVLRAAVATLTEMASFEEAGVAGPL